MNNLRYFLLMFAVLWAPQMTRTEAAVGVTLVIGYAISDLLMYIGRRMRDAEKDEGDKR